MVSAIFLLHWADVDVEYLRCELLLHRCYFNNIPEPLHLVSRFYDTFRQLKYHERTPFIHDKGLTYIHLWGENDIMIMAVSRQNVNALLVVTFLHEIHGVLVQFFEKPLAKAESDGQAVEYDMRGLTRERVIDNYPLVFELLDECMDFGVMQLTDYNILKEYIKSDFSRPSQASHLEASDLQSSDEDEAENSKQSRKKRGRSKSIGSKSSYSTHNVSDKSDVLAEQNNNIINSSILRTQALAISWRPKGIFYPKNEIYIDIEENNQFLYDLHTNKVKINEIAGVCEIKSYLSGMPNCQLGLNEKYISQVENDDDEEEEEEDMSTKSGNLISGSAQANGNIESVYNGKPPKRLKVPIQNAQFHQCIDLSPVYKENLIRFIPPDDKFTLLSYNVDQQRRKDKKPLVMVEPSYRVLQKENKLQVLCSVNLGFKKRLHCKALIVRLPINPRLFEVNNNTKDQLRFKAEIGDVQFRVDSSELVWGIADLAGSQHTVRMMAELAIENSDKISMLSVEAEIFRKGQVPDSTDMSDSDSEVDELDAYYGVNGASSNVFKNLQAKAKRASNHNEVLLDFDIPLLAYSGLRITYLKVEEETFKYTCFPWVRYLTKARSGQANGNKAYRSSNNSSGYRFRLAPRCFQII